MFRFRTVCALRASQLARFTRKPAAALSTRTRRVNHSSSALLDPATVTVFLAAALSVGLALNSLGGTKCESGRYLTANFVADAIEDVAPAVVNISCFIDGFLLAGVSSGSGFILTEDGYIVTNAHVVASATDGKVLVTTMNGKKRTGVVHSFDAQSDIALVKIDSEYSGEKYPTATLGTSGKLRNGDFVVALGSPIQLQNSCSFGIVSATARHASELGFTNNRAEYIQTDAAINNGNSGGPLVNLQGQVIGINTMKVKDAVGISFAIPSDLASQVIKQLMQYKRVIRPYVGLNMVNFVPARSAQSAPVPAPPAKKSTGWFGRGDSNTTAPQEVPKEVPVEGKRAKQRRTHMETFYDTQQVQVIVQRVVPGSPAHKCGMQT